MSQPGQIVLNWSSVLDGIYAGLLVAASGITALDPGTISHPTQQIIVLLIAVVSAFLARFAGIKAASNATLALQADNEALASENASLRAQGAASSVTPEPAPTVTGATLHLSDGSDLEATVQ